MARFRFRWWHRFFPKLRRALHRRRRKAFHRALRQVYAPVLRKHFSEYRNVLLEHKLRDEKVRLDSVVMKRLLQAMPRTDFKVIHDGPADDDPQP